MLLRFFFHLGVAIASKDLLLGACELDQECSDENPLHRKRLYQRGVQITSASSEIALAGQLIDILHEAGSLGVDFFGRLGDNTSVDLMKRAHLFSEELLHATKVAPGSSKDSRLLVDNLRFARAEHEVFGAAAQYVPIMSFIDSRFAQMTQTCSGEPVDKPMVGVSKDGCASACDANSVHCVGYSYYSARERSLCFLFSKLNTVTYYPECKAGATSFFQSQAKGEVTVAKWECGKDGLPFQSTTRDSGITRIESLNIGTGEYKTVFEIPRSHTDPPFRSINSCAINPQDGILHCSMEINNRGSFLVRIDKTQVAFVAKLPGWRYSATFDDDGNYYIYGNSGLSVIEKVTELPSYSNLLELGGPDLFTHPKDFPMGADLAVLSKDLEGIGVQKYLLSLQDTSLHVARVSTSEWKTWTLPCEGVMPPKALTWGSAWRFGGKFYFAADTGEGVHELDINSINLNDGGVVTLKRVSDAQLTHWNDGFNCFEGHDPFDPDHVKEWDCENQPRALQVTTTHLTVPTNKESKSFIEFLNIEEGKYELLFEVRKSWTDPPFNCINSCAINPNDNIIHCTMEIDNRGSFLVRIDDTKVGYVAKVPGWQYAGIFDSKGNYYMYGNSGVSVMTNVAALPTKKSYLELGHDLHYDGPQWAQMGADLAVLEKDLEGKEETYLLAIESSHLHVLRVSTLPFKKWKLWGEGLPQSESAITWGSAWNFDGGIFFAPDSAEGVFQLMTNTIDLDQKSAKFVKVGKSQETSWNDGFSCSKAIAPFTMSALQQSMVQQDPTLPHAAAAVDAVDTIGSVDAQMATIEIQCMAKPSMLPSFTLDLANVSRANGCF